MHASRSVLGATGSIGASALDVIARHPRSLARQRARAPARKVDALLALCRTHRPEHAVIADDAALRRAARRPARRRPATPGARRRRRTRSARRRRCLRHRGRRDRRRGGPAVDAGRRARRQAPAARQQGIAGARRRTADAGRARRRARRSCRSTASTTRSSSACPTRTRTPGLQAHPADRLGRAVPRPPPRRPGRGHARAGRARIRNGRWGRRSRSTRPR